MSRQFLAVIQREYGQPREVLRLAELPLSVGELASDEMLVRVTCRPIHLGDIHILSGLPQGGPVIPIPEGEYRVPGFEGVGVVELLGEEARTAYYFRDGQRVAFFPARGAWGEYIKISAGSVIAVPESIPDRIAAQMLINTITASTLLRFGHAALKGPVGPLTYILQTGAASSVGKLLTQLAVDQRLHPIRLVRSERSAANLERVLPHIPTVVATGDWPSSVRRILGPRQLGVAFDAIGGSFIDALAGVVDEGGTIINYGSLGGNHGTNIYALAPKSISLKSVSISSWSRLSVSEKSQDFALAVRLAQSHPTLFDVSAQYDLLDFAEAIAHVEKPDRVGVVILNSTR